MPPSCFHTFKIFPLRLKKLATEIASISYFRPSAAAADSLTSSPGVDERVAGFWQSSTTTNTNSTSADSSSTTTSATNTRGPSAADDSGCHSPDSMIQAPSIKRMSICSSCGKQITDPFIFRVSPNLEFHGNCLKCCNCERELHESGTAFVRNGQTFCRDDYLRLFGRCCCRCQKIFETNDMVMRAKNLVYHIPCFTCFTCRQPLRHGERFLIRHDELYCRQECFAASTAGAQCKQQQQQQESYGSHNNLHNNNHTSWDSMDLSQQDLSPQSNKSLEECISTSSTPNSLCVPIGMPQQYIPSTLMPINGNNNGNSHHHHHNRSSISSSSNNSLGSMSMKKSKKDKPSTRVRTVLSESQLRILKQMYTQNSRPDAVTKDHLVEATGLSARVIRVWFQNKRCKDKKRQTAMKEAQRTMEKEQALHGVRLNGIGPLIVEAASTDPNLDITPLNIHQYPQNPNLWASTCPDDNSPEMAQMPPPPYMTLMNHGNYGNNNNDMPSSGDYGYPSAAGGGYNMPVGHGISADYSSLSSPSCSD